MFAKSNEGKEWKIESKPNYREIFNDINGDLINFWRYIKYHPEAFHKELEQYMASRELFKEMIEQKPRTDLERAVLFYYKLSCSFGGLSRSFALRGGSNLIPLFNEEKVRKASDRLKNVVIDNLSFEKLITKYDRDFTFFYVDPPYYDKEDVYDRDSIDVFTQHQELRKLLGTVKGKWLLSYNDHPKVREMYKGYDIQKAETLYSLSGKTIPKTEILIKNY